MKMACVLLNYIYLLDFSRQHAEAFFLEISFFKDSQESQKSLATLESFTKLEFT
jgi:hypothetical protein